MRLSICAMTEVLPIDPEKDNDPTTQKVTGHPSLKPPALAAIDAVWDEVERELPTCSAGLPAFGPLVHFAPSTQIAEILAALSRDGAVIIDRAVSGETCDRIIAEMDPYLEDIGFGDRGLGQQTKRLGGVCARSPGSWEVLQHPILMKVCEAVLGRQLLHQTNEGLQSWLHKGLKQFPFQLSLNQIICIGPGNRAQSLHRDQPEMINLAGKGLEAEVSTIWALNDLTLENGATRVVPGSHRWDPERRAKPEEVVQAVMPKGSVVIYLASTLHSGGENRSREKRWGLNIDYNLASLKQEENMFLSCPPEIAAKLPAELQALLGYTMPGPSLNYVTDFHHPIKFLEKKGVAGDRTGKPVNWATKDLPEFQQSKL